MFTRDELVNLVFLELCRGLLDALRVEVEGVKVPRWRDGPDQAEHG